MAYIKVIQSGEFVEVFKYDRSPPLKRRPPDRPRRKRLRNVSRRADSIVACRKQFVRLVRANLRQDNPPALLTLTMREIVDMGDAYKAFTAFGAKLRREYGGDVSYIAVPEFQKRGAVHFHMLLFGLPYEAYKSERSNRRIATLWGHGFVDIIKTNGNPRLSNYLGKYMSKAMHDSRLIGKRAYSASRNVVRPVSLRTGFQIRTAFEEWGLTVDNEVVSQREYGTLFLGRCVYQTYVIQKHVGTKCQADPSEGSP